MPPGGDRKKQWRRPRRDRWGTEALLSPQYLENVITIDALKENAQEKKGR